MEFSEHELTTAVTAAAKSLMTAQRKDVRQGKISVDEVWNAMSRLERYELLKAMGAQVLPVLLALPDIEVPPGERPTFTQEQIEAAVTERLEEGAGGKIRRKLMLAGRVALVQTALAQLPPRADPDTFIVPDFI